MVSERAATCAAIDKYTKKAKSIFIFYKRYFDYLKISIKRIKSFQIKRLIKSALVIDIAVSLISSFGKTARSLL